MRDLERESRQEQQAALDRKRKEQWRRDKRVTGKSVEFSFEDDSKETNEEPVDMVDEYELAQQKARRDLMAMSYHEVQKKITFYHSALCLSFVKWPSQVETGELNP